jgi:hypothetical protein
MVKNSKKVLSKNNRMSSAAVNRILTAPIPYSPGTTIQTLVVEGDAQKFTTTVTTGLIASSLAIELGNIPSFAARFGAVYDSARIVKVLFEFRPCSSTTSGMAKVWVEPTSSASPTAAAAANNRTVKFSLGSNDKVAKLLYHPSDYQYLEFIPTSTTTSVVGYLNVYTDNANYASPVAATDAFVLCAKYTIQLRGFL